MFFWISKFLEAFAAVFIRSGLLYLHLLAAWEYCGEQMRCLEAKTVLKIRVSKSLRVFIIL